jgi:hypothetical protein
MSRRRGQCYGDSRGHFSVMLLAFSCLDAWLLEGANPEVLTSKAIQGVACGSLWKHSSVKGYVTLEHESVRFPLLVCCSSIMKRASRVSRAVQELGSRVTKINFIWINYRAVSPLRFVVNDGSTTRNPPSA